MTGVRTQQIRSLILPGVAPFPGAVAVANVEAWREGHTDGKLRPVVLADPVRCEPGVWRAWGLTSKPTYADGLPRTPAAGLRSVGLDDGHVWGPRLVFLPEASIVGVLWAAPLSLLRACISTGTITKMGSGGWDPEFWADIIHEIHVEDGWTWPRGPRP